VFLVPISSFPLPVPILYYRSCEVVKFIIKNTEIGTKSLKYVVFRKVAGNKKPPAGGCMQIDS
jgi:hypothetical protein